MAEKINLFELDIDVDQAIKDTAKMAEEVRLLREQTNKVKKEQGESSEEYVRYSTALKSAQGDLRTQQGLLTNLTKVNNSQTGSVEQMRKQLSVVSVQWAQLSEEERQNEQIGGKLAKQKLDLTNALKGEEEATGDARRNIGNYSDSIKGLVPGYGAATAAQAGFKKGLDLLAAHPIVAVITLIVAALVGMFQALKKNQEFSDKLAEVWGMLSAILDVLVEVVIKTGMAIINMFKSVDGEASAFSKTFTKIKDAIVSVFEDPKAAIASLWEFIKGQFVNRLQGLIKLVTAGGKIIKESLSGNFKEAGEAAKEAGKAFLEMNTGVKFEDIEKAANKVGNAIQGIVSGIKDMSTELQNAARDAAEIEKLKVRIRKNQIAITEANSANVLELAKARAIEADTTKSTEERLTAIKAAMAIEEERNNRALNHQKMMVQLAEMEMAATPELQRTDEQRLKIAQERAALAEMEAQSLNFRREIITKIAGLETAAAKAKADAFAAESDLMIKAIEEELEAERMLAEEKIKLGNELIAKSEEDRLKRLEAAELNFQNELALLENNEIAKLNKEREYLELKKAQEMEFAEAIGADTSLINQKYAEFEKQIEQEKIQSKLSLQAQFAGNLASIFGENTKVGKMAAAAETTINAFKAAQGAYAALAPIPVVGPALGIAAGAAALKTGFDNVKKIYAVKSGLPGEGGGGGAGGGGSMGSAQSVTPSLGQGLASRGSSVNQVDAIRDGVSQALQATPLQPTLVTDNVTASQNSDVRRNETSTL